MGNRIKAAAIKRKRGMRMDTYFRGTTEIEVTDEDKEKGILLWKAPRAPAPEACAELSYGDQKYLIPYSLMDLLVGWVAIGMYGTFGPWDARTNMATALRDLNTALGSASETILKEHE